jgi:DNA-binding transcriptional LysR family regulator
MGARRRRALPEGRSDARGYAVRERAARGAAPYDEKVELELRHLRCIVAVAEHRSISGAADRLGVAQSALSTQLRRVERMLGAELFMRGRTGTEPTRTGAELVVRAHAILREVDELVSGVTGRVTKAAAVPATLRLAVIDRIGLPLAVLEDLHPTLRVDVLHCRDHEAPEALHTGQVDMCHGVEQPGAPVTLARGLRQATTVVEPLWLVVGRHHPLASRTRVRLTDLRDQPWIVPAEEVHRQQALARSCAAAGFEPRFVEKVTNAVAAAELIRAGEGIDLRPPLSGSDLGDRCVSVPLLDDLRVRRYLAWRESMVPDHLARDVLHVHRLAYQKAALRVPGYWNDIGENPDRYGELLDPEPPGWPAARSPDTESADGSSDPGPHVRCHGLLGAGCRLRAAGGVDARAAAS